MIKHTNWQQLKATELQDRLREVKQLLEQAAALAAAEDSQRLATMTELQRRTTETSRGNPQRRRYR